MVKRQAHNERHSVITDM